MGGDERNNRPSATHMRGHDGAQLCERSLRLWVGQGLVKDLVHQAAQGAGLGDAHLDDLSIGRRMQGRACARV